jgi:antitoxin component YwqK of YwqJK toxin-antitoxin module
MKRYLMLLILTLSSFALYGQNKSYVGDPDGNVEYTSKTDDGRLIEKGNYWIGKKSGIWYSYHTNGEVQSIALFKNDKRDGKWKFFNEDGLLIAEVVYKDDRRISAVLHKRFDNN